MRAIQNKDHNYPIARHFETHHFSNRDLLAFFVIDQITLLYREWDRIQQLRQLESRCIIDLETKGEFGWNLDEELRIHL